MDERDDFWDLPEITPKRHAGSGAAPRKTDTGATEITFGSGSGVKKYLIPKREAGVPEKRSEVILQYEPEDSLILDVKICRWPTDYAFYNRFLQDAEKYYRAKCDETPFVPFFSYMPQYNQMNIDQLRFYLYWRRQVGHGNYIKTDYSYIFLYLYELINLESVSTPEKRLAAMCSLLLGYRDTFKSLDRYIGEWICDFCLIHRLPPPVEALGAVREELMSVVTLREFYVPGRNDVHDTALRDFIIRNNTYKYENSAAYNEKTKPVFDAHLIRSVIYTLEKTENIRDGEPSLARTKVSRTAYNGALCTSQVKCRIDAEYLSLNRSFRFRGLIGSLVKCAENNIRASLGIKSRLSVGGLSEDAIAAMRQYFEINLPPVIRRPVRKATDEDIKYELYEAKSTGLDPAQAARLESESWDLTRRLVEEEEEPRQIAPDPLPGPVYAPVPSPDDPPYTSLCCALSALQLNVLRLIASGDAEGAEKECQSHGALFDAVLSEINDAAYEYTGDVVIEGAALIPDYECDVIGALKEV
ncbi:MAG: TerB N-terminal domain-containing protein [Clostridia bacterium]|nr:TerB N-terminal domain-containing protein [Clostridia bacterium]